MKKICYLLIIVVVLSIALSGCTVYDTVHQTQEDILYSKYYAEAVSLGFDGTLEEFLSIVKGNDGVGISKVNIDENGCLILTYSDENSTQVNLGVIKGDNGDSLIDISIDSEGFLCAKLEGEETAKKLGKVKGTDGKSISSAVINESGHLVLCFTDDSKIDIGSVVGKDGINGINGTNGEDGLDGKDGENGIDGRDGGDGTNGVDGEDGLSAYEIYKKYYPEYSKTEKEWLLDFLKGNLVPKHNVTFHYYDGKENLVKSVAELDTVTAPTDTNRDGYNFIGWKLGNEQGEFYNFTTQITESIDVYASYQKDEPILQDKGLLSEMVVIPIESIYKFTLNEFTTTLCFESSSGTLDCTLYNSYDDSVLLNMQTKIFSVASSSTNFDISELSSAIEEGGCYIVVEYRGNSGALTLSIA